MDANKLDKAADDYSLTALQSKLPVVKKTYFKAGAYWNNTQLEIAIEKEIAGVQTDLDEANKDRDFDSCKTYRAELVGLRRALKLIKH